MAMDKKVQSMFSLMELLVERKEIKASDEKIANLIGYSTKTLGRHLDDLATMYGNIITVKKGKNKVYELVDISYVLEKIMTSTNDLYWLFDLLNRWDSSIFKDISYEVSTKERDVFLYKNSPFEELETQKQKNIFTTLKIAIINKKYIDINYVYEEDRIHQEVIPLKLIFMHQNWYVAIVDKEIGIRFLRISFIDKVDHVSIVSYESDISESQLISYAKFLKTFQNPMSRYDKPRQTAHLLASPKIAKYFKPHMKRHFLSEKFIANHADGSVEFSINYSQSIEILPFVKRWLPDMKILSPKSLDNKLRADLKAYLG